LQEIGVGAFLKAGPYIVTEKDGFSISSIPESLTTVKSGGLRGLPNLGFNNFINLNTVGKNAFTASGTNLTDLTTLVINGATTFDEEAFKDYGQITKVEVINSSNVEEQSTYLSWLGFNKNVTAEWKE
jgi:hypothetical protein